MAEHNGGRFSLWRAESISQIDEDAARALAARTMELRGRSRDEIAARDAYLDLLGIAPGQRVLEVGCGSGVVLRELARRVAPDGTVVGLDPSPGLLTVARELADEAGLGASIELYVGDAHALPFSDGEFDAVIAVTALSHIQDAEQVIPEMVRVTRPGGGRVGVFDRDGDSYLLAHPDRDLTRRIIAAGADGSAVNPVLIRQMPALFGNAGLLDIGVRAFTSVEQDPSGFYATNGGERWADIAVQTGAVTDEDRQLWVAQLREVADAGGFLAGMTQLFVWGSRP